MVQCLSINQQFELFEKVKFVKLLVGLVSDWNFSYGSSNKSINLSDCLARLLDKKFIFLNVIDLIFVYQFLVRFAYRLCQIFIVQVESLGLSTQFDEIENLITAMKAFKSLWQRLTWTTEYFVWTFIDSFVQWKFQLLRLYTQPITKTNTLVDFWANAIKLTKIEEENKLDRENIDSILNFMRCICSFGTLSD